MARRSFVRAAARAVAQQGVAQAAPPGQPGQQPGMPQPPLQQPPLQQPVMPQRRPQQQPAQPFNQPPRQPMQPQYAASALPYDSPSFGYALLGFLFPLIGLIFYFIQKPATPLQARSWGRGALLGSAFQLLILVPVFTYLGRAVQPDAQMSANMAVSRSYQKQLALAVLQFTQDHNEQLPDMSSMDAFKAAVSTYVAKNSARYGTTADIFASPTDGQPYVLNSKLSNLDLAKIDSPSTMPLLWESSAVPDYRDVVFVDGHTERVIENHWLSIKSAAGIP